MSCNLQYSNGKLTGVFDDQGNPSKLYQEAKNKFGEEKGLEIYLVSKSDSFIEVFGEERPKKSIESLSKESLTTLDKEYFGYDTFDWNKESQRPNFTEWQLQNKKEKFEQNIDKLIKDTSFDINLKKQSAFVEKKLKDFEELIIPVLGNKVLVPELSKFMEKVLLDPYLTEEKYIKALEESKNIITKDGSIDISKLEKSTLFEGDSISLPAFEKFVKNNKEFQGVFNDWKKLLDMSTELMVTETKAYRSSTPLSKIEKLNSELKEIRSNLRGEPQLQTVLNYIAQNNRTEESLSKEELLDVFNASLISGEINPKDFYDKDGLFTIPKKYYTNYEYSNLVDDIELQKKVKQTVDKMLNTEEVIISDTKVENPEKTTQVTALGKLNILNPNVVKQEILDLAVQNNETEEQYLNAVSELGYSNTTIPFEETKQYKKAEVYYQTEEGEIVPAMKDGNIELTLPLVAKQTENTELIKNIQFLSSKSLSVLEQNSEQTYTILKKIEDDLIKEGVDIIGITEQPINEELVSFLDDLGLFLVAPTKENMSNFISSHRNIFDLNSQEVKVKAVKEDRTDIDLVELSNTSLTEEQVYEKAGLIKYKENLYIKTAKEDLETLYNNLSTYTEKYPSNKTLQEHVQEEVGKGDYQRFNNPEVAEAVFLYKMYFDVKTNRTYYHGTNKKNANRLLKTQEIDFSKLNTKGGKNNKAGLLGEGFYLSNEKIVAQQFTEGNDVLIVSIDESKVLDISNFEKIKSDIKDWYFKYINSKRKLNNARQLSKQETDDIVNSFYTSYDSDFVSAINDFAKENKKLGLRFDNDITVVFDSKAFTKISSSSTVNNEKMRTNFTGNYEYLTGEYISDFYVDYLKEKQKDSTKWKNFYSNFEVTPLGITLKQTDNITLQQVKIMADENLKQYSIISKQMPLLTEETEPINKRDSLVNNPQQLEEYSGNSYIVDDNNIITNNSDNEFIRVGNDVYEATDAFENLVLYSKLKGEGKEGYYSFGAIKPKTEVNLKDYAYLHKQKDIFLKEEKYLTEEEKNQLKENKYNC